MGKITCFRSFQRIYNLQMLVRTPTKVWNAQQLFVKNPNPNKGEKKVGSFPNESSTIIQSSQAQTTKYGKRSGNWPESSFTLQSSNREMGFGHNLVEMRPTSGGRRRSAAAGVGRVSLEGWAPRNFGGGINWFCWSWRWSCSIFFSLFD